MGAFKSSLQCFKTISSIKELLNIAMERQTNQEKWNALAVKIPEFAPWAHFGFTRLKRTLEHAQNVYFNKDL